MAILRPEGTGHKYSRPLSPPQADPPPTPRFMALVGWTGPLLTEKKRVIFSLPPPTLPPSDDSENVRACARKRGRIFLQLLSRRAHLFSSFFQTAIRRPAGGAEIGKKRRVFLRTSLPPAQTSFLLANFVYPCCFLSLGGGGGSGLESRFLKPSCPVQCPVLQVPLQRSQRKKTFFVCPRSKQDRHFVTMRYQVCVAVLVAVVGLTIGDKSGKSFSPMYKKTTLLGVSFQLPKTQLTKVRAKSSTTQMYIFVIGEMGVPFRNIPFGSFLLVRTK